MKDSVAPQKFSKLTADRAASAAERREEAGLQPGCGRWDARGK